MTDTNFFGVDNWMVPSKMYLEAQAEVARLTAERDALRNLSQSLLWFRDKGLERECNEVWDSLRAALNNVTTSEETAI